MHLDLANNYGPPPFAAEESVGRMLARDLRRDELVITTKAGYRAWPGPYGEHGSRKYLLASLDESLRRLGTDRVDVFYSHRFDPETPLEETLGALRDAVRSGKAALRGDLVVLRRPDRRCARRRPVARAAARGAPARVLDAQPLGGAPRARRPVAARGRRRPRAWPSSRSHRWRRGSSSTRYLNGIPADSRAARGGPLRPEWLTDDVLDHVRALDTIARSGGRTLPQLALAWVLRDPRVTSVLAGARTTDQLDENLAAATAPPLDDDEIAAIEPHAVDAGINLWGSRSSDL